MIHFGLNTELTGHEVRRRGALLTLFTIFIIILQNGGDQIYDWLFKHTILTVNNN